MRPKDAGRIDPDQILPMALFHLDKIARDFFLVAFVNSNIFFFMNDILVKLMGLQYLFLHFL